MLQTNVKFNEYRWLRWPGTSFPSPNQEYKKLYILQQQQRHLQAWCLIKYREAMGKFTVLYDMHNINPPINQFTNLSTNQSNQPINQSIPTYLPNYLSIYPPPTHPPTHPPTYLPTYLPTNP